MYLIIKQAHHTILCSLRYSFLYVGTLGLIHNQGIHTYIYIYIYIYIYARSYMFVLPLRRADTLSKESCCVLFVRIRFQTNGRPWAALASSSSDEKQRNRMAFTLSVPFNDTVSSSDYIACVVDEWMTMEHWWYDSDSGSRGTQRKTCLNDTLYLGADQYLILICEQQVEVWIQVFWHVTLCCWFSGSRRFEEMRGLFRKEVSKAFERWRANHSTNGTESQPRIF